MNHQRTTRRLSALAMAALLFVGAAACGSSDDDSGTEGATDTTSSDSSGDTSDTTSASAGDTPAEATAPVIEDFNFIPDPIEIAAGDAVTWTNNDGFAHTVTADDDSFDSGNMDQDATFEQTFDEAGEFAYHCNIHTQMTGTVTVTS